MIDFQYKYTPTQNYVASGNFQIFEDLLFNHNQKIDQLQKDWDGHWYGIKLLSSIQLENTAKELSSLLKARLEIQGKMSHELPAIA